MFRAAMCPSGELIVSLRHLVYVTLYGWPFSVQVWMRLHTKRSSIQSDIPNVVLMQFSWWWAHGCPKHVENRSKHIWKRIVREVGYLQRRLSTLLLRTPLWNPRVFFGGGDKLIVKQLSFVFYVTEWVPLVAMAILLIPMRYGMLHPRRFACSLLALGSCRRYLAAPSYTGEKWLHFGLA